MKYFLILGLILLMHSQASAQSKYLSVPKPGKVYLDGQKLHRLDVDVMMQRNPDALLVWNQAKTNRGMGGVLVFIGGFGLGWGLGHAISPPREITSSSTKNPAKVAKTMTLIGAISLVASVPFTITGNNRTAEAVSRYNDSLPGEVKSHSFWRLGGGPFGLALSLHF